MLLDLVSVWEIIRKCASIQIHSKTRKLAVVDGYLMDLMASWGEWLAALFLRGIIMRCTLVIIWRPLCSQTILIGALFALSNNQHIVQGQLRCVLNGLKIWLWWAHLLWNYSFLTNCITLICACGHLTPIILARELKKEMRSNSLHFCF